MPFIDAILTNLFHCFDFSKVAQHEVYVKTFINSIFKDSILYAVIYLSFKVCPFVQAGFQGSVVLFPVYL